MPIVCGIKFREASKVYFFSPGEITDLQEDDYVIVETARGTELGRVVMPPREVDASEVVGELKPVLRRATPLELVEAEKFRQSEEEALRICREEVRKANLPMKIVGAEYSFDGSRLTFFFTSEQRIDFRDLVRNLAHLFKARIELRQIGVRDEARLLGGLGKCGRPLCCATWLSDFAPVSIRMAKEQNLPLSPAEISGLCGRLLCCLAYEHEYYHAVRGVFPKVGKMVETPFGPVKVVKVSVLQETVTLLLADGSTIELTADQLAGKEPCPALAKRNGRRASLEEQLARVLPATSEGAKEEGKPKAETPAPSNGGKKAPGKRPPEPRRAGEPGPAPTPEPAMTLPKRRRARPTPKADQAKASGSRPSRRPEGKPKARRAPSEGAGDPS